ncbi:LDAP Interacting Protein [Hibiscus trionum]|nr:LDAP Interacting Protein [Hibiscus trionum]
MTGATVDENRGSLRADTLYGLLHRWISMIIFPDSSSPASTSLLERIKIFVSENGSRLREASRNTRRTVLLWTPRGSPLRTLLVISAGTMSLLILSGVVVFILFFAAATVNAIIVYLVLFFASTGGFMVLLFAYVASVYIGALSVAAFLISNATISAIAAVAVTTGWAGVILGVWSGTKKSLEIANYSFTLMRSAHSAYSSQLTYLGV